MLKNGQYKKNRRALLSLLGLTIFSIVFYLSIKTSLLTEIKSEISAKLIEAGSNSQVTGNNSTFFTFQPLIMIDKINLNKPIFKRNRKQQQTPHMQV